MRYYQNILKNGLKFFLSSVLVIICYTSNGQQKISIGLHADPVISWFGTDIEAVRNNGARAGFSFGLNINRSFTPNYSFSTGINLTSAGGRLNGKDTTVLELSNEGEKLVTVKPNESIIYKIQYLSVPLGLKLKTNQIGYLTFFSDAGIDPKIVVGGKVEIPSLGISGEKAMHEMRTFNLGYHIIAGIEYGIGGNTAFLFGLGFENNFLDVTRENGDQPKDIITHKLLSFRFGIVF